MRSLALLVILAATTAHADRLAFDPAGIYNVPRGDSPAWGPTDAPLTIVVWSDYACGFCNRVQGTLDQLDRLYPQQIRWVHRTLPLDMDNTVAAEAALAAGAQGKFLPMHARLFALHGRVARGDLELIAREIGLDMLRFRAELDAGTYRASIARDVQDATRLGVTGTPTFFINGRPIDGARPLKVFTDVVDEELARAATAPAANRGYEALVAQGKTAADKAEEVDRDPGDLDPRKLYRVGLGLPGHQLGPDDALVTIVEFSDFQCPYCARQAPVLENVQKKHASDVRVIYRHFPVQGHRGALVAAEAAAAAADQGKFWPFHDQLFGHFNHLTRADLESYAQASGLDMARFRRALDEHRFRDAVVAEGAAASALGADGTPTMFINGLPLVGARDEETLDKLIGFQIDRAKELVARGVARGDIYPLLMSMAEGADRADPTLPDASVAKIEMRADDRARAVVAACRRHDADRARTLASSLSGDVRRRAFAVCAGAGIDL
jgi:protein-disulfide isomerase